MASEPVLKPRLTGALDIHVRIQELEQLKPGWLDGKGESLSSQGLDWLASSFDSYYPGDIPLPYLFPTHEGRILAEWKLKSWSPSLEIDLDRKTGEWHNLNLKTDHEETATFDLANAEGWDQVAEKVRRAAAESA